MSLRLVAAAVFSLVAIALLVAELVSWPQSADLAPTSVSDTACSLQLLAANDADRAAGLREGDRLLLPEMDETARIAAVFHATPTQAARAGERTVLSVQRGDQRISLPYQYRHIDPVSKFLEQLVFKLFILAVGVLVLLRGRDRASLVLGIWCLGVCVALPDSWWGLFGSSGRLVGGALTSFLWTYSPFMLYLVLESIATGVSRSAVLVTRTLMALTIAPEIVINTINATAQARTGCAVMFIAPWIGNALFSAPQLIIIGFFVLSYLRTTGLARQRVRWVFWAFLVSRFGVLLNLLNRLAPHPIHLSGVEFLTVMIFPLGCAYAILRHRIIDVNFVLNRTLVYTILTTLVVGIFILVENVLNAVAVSRGVGLAVEIAVALGLGLSLNALHKRVEGALERTLFRRKFQAVLALRQLSDEAAYTENAQALLQRATTEIPAVLGAAGAAVYERREDGYALALDQGLPNLPQTVGVDDLAFVRLRARLSQVDLGDVESALGSDAVAFALVVRGQLIGAFLCGRRTNGESYAPDEIRMVRDAAHAIAAELYAIRARERAELLVAVTSGAIDLETARIQLRALGPILT